MAIDIIESGHIDEDEELTGDIVSIDFLSGDIIDDEEVSGHIEEDKELAGNIVSVDILSGNIDGDDLVEGHIDEAIVRVYEPLEEYDGDYTIRPKFDNQVLDVDNKKMTSDLTVTSIPISITSNLSGGKTVYIG